MINLTPIPQQIQKRLFEKMKVLGRENLSETNQSKDTNSLNHTKMATRSTFLRMTSGQINPVVLMGGKLKEGYDVNKNWLKNTLLPNIHHHSDAVRNFYFYGPFIEIMKKHKKSKKRFI